MLALSTLSCDALTMHARKRYHHGDLRTALLDASLTLIREKGASGFTIREAARLAGVSHNAPYRPFRDKDELLAAIAECCFKRLTAKIQKSVSKCGGPFERLQGASKVRSGDSS